MVNIQTVQVETYGKGKDFSRIEATSAPLTFTQFRLKFSVLFNEFSRHVVVSWFLNNTKSEMTKPLEKRQHTVSVNSDFAQNVTVDRKQELADQYFHKPEILLFGGVASVVLPSTHGPAASPEDRELHISSHLVSSDYRYLKHWHGSDPISGLTVLSQGQGQPAGVCGLQKVPAEQAGHGCRAGSDYQTCRPPGTLEEPGCNIAQCSPLD